MASSRFHASIANNGVRYFSTTSACFSLRNFRKIQLYNFRGGRRFRERQKENPDPDIPIYHYGVREPGYTLNGKFHLIPEMIPELVVPDLTDCELKPYVSYNVVDVVQHEFTAKDLFDAIYMEKIVKDFHAGKLDERGNALHPNDFEKLTPEEAKLNARKAGSDMFDEIIRKKDEQ